MSATPETAGWSSTSKELDSHVAIDSLSAAEEHGSWPEIRETITDDANLDPPTTRTVMIGTPRQSVDVGMHAAHQLAQLQDEELCRSTIALEALKQERDSLQAEVTRLTQSLPTPQTSHREGGKEAKPGRQRRSLFRRARRLGNRLKRFTDQGYETLATSRSTNVEGLPAANTTPTDVSAEFTGLPIIEQTRNERPGSMTGIGAASGGLIDELTGSIESSLADNDHCIICQQKYAHRETPLALKCGHTFGSLCLNKWIHISGRTNGCPVCRAQLFDRKSQEEIVEEELGPNTTQGDDAELASVDGLDPEPITIEDEHFDPTRTYIVAYNESSTEHMRHYVHLQPMSRWTIAVQEGDPSAAHDSQLRSEVSFPIGASEQGGYYTQPLPRNALVRFVIAPGDSPQFMMATSNTTSE